MKNNLQREFGHIDIANGLVDAFIKNRIPGDEWRILWVIIRKTWGYCELINGKKVKDKHGFFVKKKFDKISISQFSELTGINRRRVSGLLKNLIDKNVIAKKCDSSISIYGIQKNYKKWKLSQKSAGIAEKCDRVSRKSATKLSQKSAHTKDNKEKLNKETFVCVSEIYSHHFFELKKHTAEMWDRLSEEYEIHIIKKAMESFADSWGGKHRDDGRGYRNGPTRPQIRTLCEYEIAKINTLKKLLELKKYISPNDLGVKIGFMKKLHEEKLVCARRNKDGYTDGGFLWTISKKGMKLIESNK